MADVKRRKFKAEMKQLMDIIINSLYSNKDIFLRELISNSVDAIDKIRFEGLTNSEVLENNTEWKIKIIPDKDKGTLTVSDNGVGMSADTITDQLGTIAKSGTAEFVEALKNENSANLPDLIGQFGVGFYSSFMVAKKVTVVSRMAGEKEKGIRWQSTGEGSYTLEEVEKETRGTDITLELKDDSKEFLDDWRIEGIVKKFSDFVEHPIVMDKEEGEGDDKKIEEEVLNSQKAIWLRSKSEIKDEEYEEFYKHLTRDMEGPAKTIHYVAEGQMEYRSLLFIPSKKPPAFMIQELAEQGPALYVNRVFITDNAENLLPPYLRFMRGVVDSSDLPLNVSREMLQDNPVIRNIQKGLVTKTLSTLEEWGNEDSAGYEKFFTEWGPLFKSGVYTDFGNREKLADLMRFESTSTQPGEYTSLAKYVEGMKEDQKEIYYLVGPDRAGMENSPYLEVFRSKGHEVLLMTDPVDEFVASGLMNYKEKPLKAVNKGELDSDKKDDEKKSEQTQYKGLLDFLKDKLDQVKEVRLSDRLTESAAVLVVEEGEMGAHMQAILKEMGQDGQGQTKRTLELNPEHDAVKSMLELFDKAPQDPRLEGYGHLLYDQAVLAEGSKIADPVAMAKRINDLIAKDAKV